MRAACPVHFIPLDLITLIIFGAYYKLFLLVSTFFERPAISTAMKTQVVLKMVVARYSEMLVFDQE
jgi:hypothetical protein